MGWFIAIVLTVVGLIKQDSIMIIAGGAFAISGSIGALVSCVKTVEVKEEEEL